MDVSKILWALIVLIVLFIGGFFYVYQGMPQESGEKVMVTIYAYEKDGSHIFDGAVIAAMESITGKIVEETVADRDGRVVFELPPGSYRFQPSPLRENRVAGSLELTIASSQEAKLLLTEIGPSAFGAPVATCEAKYDAIESAFENANYCESDADCKAIQLGGGDIDFGCWKYVNQSYDMDILFARMKDYRQSCILALNDCAIALEAKCVKSKCVLKNSK